jgi:hypothetical protein
MTQNGHITIWFASNPDLKLCTPAQKKTYSFLRESLAQSRRLKVRQVLEALQLKTLPPLVSRLNHLQKKGLITWVVNLEMWLTHENYGNEFELLIGEVYTKHILDQ